MAPHNRRAEDYRKDISYRGASRSLLNPRQGASTQVAPRNRRRQTLRCPIIRRTPPYRDCTERPHQQRTLRDRIHDHIKGPIGSSTLRRTLSVRMVDQLILWPLRSPYNRLSMPADDKAQLTDWMRASARLAWVVCEQRWHLEKALISNGLRLPPNIRGSHDPTATLLSAIWSTSAF